MKLTHESLQTVIDHLPCGVTLVDSELNMLAYNNEFMRLLDFPQSLVATGETAFETFIRYNVERGEYGPGDPEEKVRAIVEQARRMQPHVLERSRPNGTVVEIRGLPLPDGGFITIYTDITERKRNEEALQRAMEQVVQLALHDPLTGLANRRKFAEHFEREMARAARIRAPLSLLIVDVDHFKAINDQHGHVAGDACLKALSTLLAASVRAVDLVARFGGEKFVVLLPDTSADQSLVAAERMRCKVQAQPVGIGHGAPPVAVTISVGAATAAGAGLTLEKILALADEAVYRAKRAGRNQVCA